MTEQVSVPAGCKTETLGVTFFDLSRMLEWSSSEVDARIASFFQSFYALSAKHIEGAGGRVVKFIGDAGLAVFGTDVAERVIFALCDLASEARALAAGFGFDTYLNINVHVGPVVAGTFGASGAAHYDVIGKTVNVAARLGRRGVTLSVQAFRCLSDEGRKRFNKIKPPVTYRLRR